MKSTRTALLTGLATILLASPASATVVSGQVTTTGGTVIGDVDLDFIDRDTGESIPLVNDDTDVLGFYAISVPTGDYDVRFKPAAGVAFVAVEERGVRVEGGGMTLDQQLASGSFVSGTVLDSNGLPVNPLDLDVVDLADGNAIFVANDNTDVAGQFSIVLPDGQFDIEFEPAIGSPLVPLRIGAIDVAGNTPLGDVVMQLGVRLRGTVLDPSFLPVGQVQVQTVDPLTGSEIFNIRNMTAVGGNFELMVAPGAVDLLLIPPRGSVSLPRYVAGVELYANLDLPDIVLDNGVLVSGLVLDASGDPAEAVDLDFASTWADVTRFTPKDNTDENGQFSIAVPAGAYDVRFDPPAAGPLAPAELLNVNIFGATGLPTVQLQNAVTVSGIVQSGGGSPLAKLDLDFLAPAGTQELPSSRDTTDGLGAFAAIVNPGNYDLRVNPAFLSGWSQVVLPGVNANNSTNVGTIVLPAATAPTVGAISPTTGPTTGGTLVTVSGSGFVEGATVRVGAFELSGVSVISPTMLQGTTPIHPAGLVAVEVVNPGAAPVASAEPFRFTAAGQDPQLTVSKAGPLGTDLLLQWTATGRPHYTVFQGTVPRPEAMTMLDATSTLSLRIDGAAAPESAQLLFFSVH